MFDIMVFLDTVQQWAASQADIAAVVLVGSYARGAARPDSDIDLVVLTTTPAKYTSDQDWLNTFGQVTQQASLEDWGRVQSWRVFYEGGPELELGISTPDWADLHPIDAGTRQVIADGAWVVYDPQGILAALIRAVAEGEQ